MMEMMFSNRGRAFYGQTMKVDLSRHSRVNHWATTFHRVLRGRIRASPRTHLERFWISYEDIPSEPWFRPTRCGRPPTVWQTSESGRKHSCRSWTTLTMSSKSCGQGSMSLVERYCYDFPKGLHSTRGATEARVGMESNTTAKRVRTARNPAIIRVARHSGLSLTNRGDKTSMPEVGNQYWRARPEHV